MSQYKELIDKKRLPKHIAIIMDGNGRWAKKMGNLRIFGHENGVTSVRETTEAAAELGINYLTLYAFSTENWNRPKEEVDALMNLLVKTIEAETHTLAKNNVKLLTIGDTSRMPKETASRLQQCIEQTANNTGLHLVLALSYSSRWEITEAIRNMVNDGQTGKLTAANIDENTINSYLATANIPDPELLIRTSGEYRISNFLLWQIAYTELYFTEVLWPDFRKDDLYQAIVNYQSRERRFGKTSEQVTQ
ncbi:MAG: isoprenyl transferase [Paludibacteraceae bacterium]|nr:isoprenyl transferase [Paludibacteraceae bacterium]